MYCSSTTNATEYCDDFDFADTLTGELLNESLLDTTYIEGPETLVAQGVELSKTTTRRVQNSNTLRKSHYARYIVQVNLTELIVSRTLTPKALSVLFYMLHHMGKHSNKFHVSQTVIAEEVGLDRANVSRAIKELLDRQCIAKMDDASIPSIQAYMVDPLLAYKGEGKDLPAKVRLFSYLLRKEARKQKEKRKA